MAPLILRLDITGQPLRWIPWREAVLLDFKSMIAWNAGDHSFTFHGGLNRLSGKRSSITVSSIIAVKGRSRHAAYGDLVPPLSNPGTQREVDDLVVAINHAAHLTRFSRTLFGHPTYERES